MPIISNFPVDNRLAHALTHAKGGSDELTPAAIGAAPAIHVADKNNPHGVTAEQVGAATKDLSNADILSLKFETSVMPGNSTWGGICYGNGKYVAVSRRQNLVAYSVDGSSWKTSTLPVSELNSVCYGDGRFLAVSNSNIAVYSTDGITWKKTTMPVSDRWTSVCYGDGKFIAVSSNGVIAISSDGGITWTKRNAPSGEDWDGSAIESVCYGNGIFVAVSDLGYVTYSTDGNTWGTSSAIGCPLRNVCYGDGKFVALTDTDTTMYSTDGENWNEGSLSTSESSGDSWPSDGWSFICYGDGRFVAVANSTLAVYSKNGVDWESVQISESGSWDCICFGGGKFVAVSETECACAVSFPQIVDQLFSVGFCKTPTAKKVTLTAAGWDSSTKTQKVTVNGVLADETKQLIMPMPAMASQNDYAAAGIACTLQEANALTFKCQTVPTADISVFVTIQEVAG